jgi:hypothetical protein
MLYSQKIADADLTYNERINIQKASCLVKTMNKQAIKNTFFNKDEEKHDGNKWSVSAYMNHIMRFLVNVSRRKTEDNVIERTYKFGKNTDRGRIYVDGQGLQQFQSNLKNYLCGEYYVDIDIVNCIPSIMLYVCETNNIPCMYLKQYCENRNEILANYNITKADINRAMNQDNPKKIRGDKENQFFNAFCAEMKINRLKILEIIEPLKFSTTNVDNPISSKVGSYFKYIEGDILQIVIKYFKDINKDICIIPYYDGANIEKIPGIKYDDELLKKLNELINSHLNEASAREKKNYINFIYKPLDCNVELDFADEDNELMDYEKVKVEFEKKFFHIKQPFSYWALSRDTDGSYRNYQLSNQDFKLACEEYKIEDFNEKGELIIRSIFNKWVGDKNKRQYETIDFLPFGKVDNHPSYIYNTFEGFKIKRELDLAKNNYNEVDVSNFNELLKNLSNHDTEKYNYLLKYIAHTFQYPDVRTEKIIIFQGWTGTGKDSLFRTLQKLMGMKYIDSTEDIEELFGNFNTILDSKICLFLNETEGKKTLEFQERLKGLCTATHNRINEKNRKRIQQQNFCRIFGATNSTNGVNIQESDRRYIIYKPSLGLVKDVKDKQQKEKATSFWNKYYEDINSFDWCASLYNYLINMPLDDFKYKESPYTEEKEIMKEKNIKKIYKYIKHIYEDKAYGGFYKNNEKEEYIIKFKDFFRGYTCWLDMTGQKPDYKIKQTDIRLQLNLCDNSFQEKRIKTKIMGEEIDGRFAIFNFNKMYKFLENFIFNETQQEVDKQYEELNFEECQSNYVVESDSDF